MSENVAEEEILESYDNVKIIRKKGEILPIYLVAEKHLNEEEEKIVENPRTLIKDYSLILKDLEVIQSIDEKESFIRKIIEKHLDESNFRIEHKEELIEKIMDYNFLGYCKLGPLMRDDKLEEIMVNSINTPIFVFHRRYGMCKTNLKFETKHEIYEFIEKVSSFVGRKINQDNPLLDGHLIDGSRINIAIPPAAPSGPSITIRKFRKSPYTIIDLIARKTISIELAAFLWLCVEGFGIHPCNILIAGSSGAGKTTLLNALAMFIPQEERVVTVEDTLELNFDFLENWVPLEAVPS
ncbi:MAG TPA: CpaF family protein, partial [Candidatus Altiarchaeales archaeon]|nr:CpaF family protein [Candidatus Altiarchaeales archaeon]